MSVNLSPAILARLNCGQEEFRGVDSFGTMVSANEKRLYNVALRMLGDPDDAADTTQDALLRAYRSFRTFRGDTKIYIWLYRILMNCCKNRLTVRRKARFHPVSSLEALQEEEAEEGFGIPDCTYASGPPLDRLELRTVIEKAIVSVPADHRTVIVLREPQGLT